MQTSVQPIKFEQHCKLAGSNRQAPHLDFCMGVPSRTQPGESRRDFFDPSVTASTSDLENPNQGDLFSDFHCPTFQAAAPITTANSPQCRMSAPQAHSSLETRTVDLWGLRPRRPHQRPFMAVQKRQNTSLFRLTPMFTEALYNCPGWRSIRANATRRSLKFGAQVSQSSINRDWFKALRTNSVSKVFTASWA
jgi:hypothetical protein